MMKSRCVVLMKCGWGHTLVLSGHQYFNDEWVGHTDIGGTLLLV